MIDNRTRRSNSFYRRFPFLKSRKLQNKFNEMYFQHFKTYPLNVSFIKWVYLIVNLCGIYIVSYFLWPFWQKIFLVVIEFIHLNLFFFWRSFMCGWIESQGILLKYQNVFRWTLVEELSYWMRFLHNLHPIWMKYMFTFFVCLKTIQTCTHYVHWKCHWSL